jgi:lysine 2,3-aminomutase
MIGVKDFKEKLSPFLCQKLKYLKEEFGSESRAYKGLALQYLRDKREGQGKEFNLKHYEADVVIEEHSGDVHGLERLYKRVLVIEPTLICAANCRYCLRSNYPKHTLSEDQLVDVAKFCGAPQQRDTLCEVLITGGDPFMVPKKLSFLIESLIEYAPNIKIIRIATRLPLQYPKQVDDAIYSIFRHTTDMHFEVATQINHPVEFFPEVTMVFRKLQSLGVKIYSQNVLLKGINDDIDTLLELYDKIRLNDIEAHYLFHCIPMKGIHYLRPTIDKALRLVKELTNSGRISGRAKPMFAAMTDIGKITFYEGVILERKSDRLLLQSQYALADRLAWNTAWKLPASAEVDENGLIRVWYQDGES